MARAVLIAALLLTSCASASRVDPSTIETLVAESVWPADDTIVTDVSCPDEVPREAGLEIVCALTFAGVPTEARVVQLDDQGSVAIDFAPTVLEATEVADDVASRLSEDLGIDVTATCDEPYSAQLLDVDVTFVCTATDPEGRPLLFEARIVDSEGAFTIELLDPS